MSALTQCLWASGTMSSRARPGDVCWGIIASLIETCKINAIDPQAYLADVLSRLVNGWPMRQIDKIMP